MKTNELYDSVTDHIASMLESGAADPAAWRAPWRAITAGQRNALGRGYRGINTLILADAAARKGYEVPVWGTFKQWKDLGASVKRGEKATHVVLWKPFENRKSDGAGGEEIHRGVYAKAFAVFNAAQVDGAENAPAIKNADKGPRNPDGRDADADAWIDATGADIAYGGDAAYYLPASDRISLPRFDDFDNGAAFYSTAAHELTHWSGASTRLNRDLSGRFGTDQYAAEELVAELGAAFAMARLGIESVPRADHAHYLASWARVLRADNHAIFLAASKAQTAADYLFGDSAAHADDDEKVKVAA